MFDPTYILRLSPTFTWFIITSLSLSRLTPLVRTISLTAHAIIITCAIARIFTLIFQKVKRKYTSQHSLTFFSIGLLLKMAFIISTKFHIILSRKPLLQYFSWYVSPPSIISFYKYLDKYWSHIVRSSIIWKNSLCMYLGRISHLIRVTSHQLSGWTWRHPVTLQPLKLLPKIFPRQTLPHVLFFL